MRKETYDSKLESMLQSAVFDKEATTDEVILKVEKELNNELVAMKKKVKGQLASELRSTGV